jgi:ABC-type dipeptide/oligopeptide/nickel transport system ATPase subunit
MAFVWTVQKVPALLVELQKNAVLFSEREIESLQQFITLKHWQLDLDAMREYFDFVKEPNNDFYDYRKMSDLESVFAEDKISLSYYLRKYQAKQRFKVIYDQEMSTMVKSQTEKD